MRLFLTALAVASLAASPSFAAPCKDAKGKFIKCAQTATPAPAAGISKDTNGKCHIASGPKKGQFTKCP